MALADERQLEPHAEAATLRPAWTSIAGLWAGGIVLSLFALAWGQTRPVRSPAAAPRTGPVIVSGVLVGPPDKRAPTGTPAVGWILESSFQSPHGVPFPRVVQRVEAEGLAIEDRGARLSVSPELLRRNDALGSLDAPVEQFGFTGVGLQGWIDPPPSGGRGFESLAHYWLTVFPRGQAVFVSGCRAGDALVRCGDDRDGIASDLGSAAPPLHRMLPKVRRRHDATLVLTGLRWTSAAGMVAALAWSLVLAIRTRRARRTLVWLGAALLAHAAVWVVLAVVARGEEVLTQRHAPPEAGQVRPGAIQ